MKLAATASSLLIFATYTFACTTVQIANSPENWVLKSYDWHQTHFTAFMNPSGLKKKAFHFKPVKNAVWRSRYASLTFNQHGRDLPLGGINEAGLVVEVMWLNATEYPTASKDQEVVNELQWIQYQLDRYSTVGEVVESARTLAITPIYARVHYLVCDSNACATVEYLDGQPVIHSGRDVVSPVLTNNSYEDSLFSLGKYLEFGGKTGELPMSSDSLDRFVRASVAAKNYIPPGKDESVTKVFGILKNVAQGEYTKLNVAYDRTNSFVYFRSAVRPSIKGMDTRRLFHSCANGREAKVLNVNGTKDGDVTDRFEAYTPEANRKLVEDGLSEMAGILPEGALTKVAEYPASFICEE